MGFMSETMFSLCQTFIVAIYAVPYVGFIIPFVLAISCCVVSNSAASIKETVRITSTTRSPLLSYLGETISGCSTIRAFNRQKDFIRGCDKLLNDNIIAVQMSSGVSCWFSMRVDILAIALMLLISFICILARDHSDPIILSMLLSYIMTI